MKNVLRKFAQFNRRGCRMLDRIFPWFFVGNKNYSVDLKNFVNQKLSKKDVKVVLEVGGIDRPLLEKNKAFTYIGLDIEERPSCYEIYDEFLVQSVEEPIPSRANLVISTTLLEHVKDNVACVHQIHECLEMNGATVHYVPSKYHPYSLILRAVGNRLQKALIDILRPDAAAVTGYPVFFDCCSPSQMRELFSTTGFKEIQVIPYYKATDYFAFLLPAYILVATLENIVEFFGFSELCSGYIIAAQKR